MEQNPQRVPVNIEDQMRESFMDYAMSVIVARALPDARDGLKPVHRRILYAMFSEGLLHNRRYSKCAGVVIALPSQMRGSTDASSTPIGFSALKRGKQSRKSALCAATAGLSLVSILGACPCVS